MSPAVAALAFGLIFVGELPDKTMFASLVLASRGRPLFVWLGAAAAFVIHVTLAVTVGAVALRVLPKRLVETVVALLFLAGAAITLRSRNDPPEADLDETGTHKAALAAFLVVFVAEWGDATQILTANLAARYDEPLSVALGAVAALWAVSGLAVVAGQKVVRVLPIRTVRTISAAALLVLATISAWSAIT